MCRISTLMNLQMYISDDLSLNFLRSFQMNQSFNLFPNMVAFVSKKEKRTFSPEW